MVRLRTPKEVEKELESISKEITETKDFLLYLRNNIKYSVSDILSFVKVNEYDSLTSELDDYQMLTLINKRRNALKEIEFSNYSEEITYQEYLEENLDFDEEHFGEPFKPMTEVEFEEDKIGKACVDLKKPLELIADIIYGEKTSITRKDLDELRVFSSLIPISETDITKLVFKNRYHGFMGAMDNEDYNKILGEVLCGSDVWSKFTKLRDIPEGYGWEGGSFTEKKILAEVNLDSSDHVLIEAFKNWLPHARKIHAEALEYESNSSDKKINPNISSKWKKIE